jgi:hypothetical protein
MLASKRLLDSSKITRISLPSFVRGQTGEAGMNGMLARQDGDTILAKDPGRSAIHAAPAQRDFVWTYVELAAVLADIREFFDIPPGGGVLIVGENSAPLLAIVEINAWSVAMKPRLSAPEVDRLVEHGAARRVLLEEIPDSAHRYADIFVVHAPRMRDVGPCNRKTVPGRVAADLRHAAAAA